MSYRDNYRNLIGRWNNFKNVQGANIERIGNIDDPNILTVGTYAFINAGLGNVRLENCTKIDAYGFYGAWNGAGSYDSVELDFPKVTTIGGDFPLQGIPGGSTVSFGSLTTMSTRIFTGTSYYIEWHFPKVTSITSSNWNYASSWRELHLDSMTMDDVMASPGWPWSGMPTPGAGYPKGVCYCSDGYITYENGAWTKFPY